MDPFMGQILTVGFNFAPLGWQTCAGQLLPIQQYTALYSLLGTSYGGNGTQNFALPNLQGRTAVGTGSTGSSTYNVGQVGGSESITLNQAQMPAHTHAATFAGTGSSFSVSANVQGATVGAVPNAVLGRGIDLSGTTTAKPALYAPAGTATDTALAGLNVAGSVTIAAAGGNSAVPVMQPFLALTQIIAVQGIYPSRP